MNQHEEWMGTKRAVHFADDEHEESLDDELLDQDIVCEGEELASIEMVKVIDQHIKHAFRILPHLPPGETSQQLKALVTLTLKQKDSATLTELRVLGMTLSESVDSALMACDA